MTAAEPDPPRSAIHVVITPRGAAGTVTLPEEEAEHTPGGDTLERARAVYDAWVAGYLKQLNGRPAPAMPVKLDTLEQVVLDQGLWEQLFDIYTCHGWDGVNWVGETIRKNLPRNIPSTWTWAAGWPFFLKVRALLAGLIRDALAVIERAAATQMSIQLSVSSVTVAKTWAFYDITRKAETRRAVGKGATVVDTPETFVFANEEPTAALFESLTEAVKRRAEYEAALQSVAGMRDSIEYHRRVKRRARAAGRPLSSARQLSSELKVKEAEGALLERRATELYVEMQKVINDRSPLGLLALEGLRPGFDRADMEGLLGAILWQTFATLDELGRRVDPDVNRVITLMPGSTPIDAVSVRAGAPAELGSPLQLAEEGTAAPGTLTAPAEGVERKVLDAALDGVAKNGGWMPLIHESTLHALVESGLIAPDSWEYVVWGRYVSTLAKMLGERRRDEEAWESFWRGFSRAASAASLALLVTPATKVGVALKGTVAIADLVLLTHSVTSVTSQLAKLDELRDRQLVDPDAFSVEGLGRLGELGAFRDRFVAGLTQRLLVEVALMTAGARWPAVKESLMLRGYLQDVETMLGEG